MIQLSAGDAAQAKSLDDEEKALLKRKQDFRQHIADTYLMESKPGSENIAYWGGGGIEVITGRSINETPAEKVKRLAEEKAWREKQAKMTHLERKNGWIDFEYSDDWKYIVPTPLTFHVGGGSFNVCPPTFGNVTSGYDR